MLTTQKEIIQQLYKLKAIAPEPAATSRGRALIFMAGEETRHFSPYLVLASALAVVIIVVSVSLRIFSVSQTTAVSATFDAGRLSQEFNNLSINIELKEISYRQDINQTIASALNEIGTNDAKHLNPAVLQSEEQSLNLENEINPQIDQLLETIIF